jgi:serine phosphatase RsbU (regulator of sigma subunit)/anti-sigma regulatory factor (Ser/Thr protein kinase)
MAGKAPERPSAWAGSSCASRDQVMAHGLRRAYRELRPDTTTTYLLEPDGYRLAAVMAVDAPLAFTLTPSMPADDLRYANSAAFQTGELVVSSHADIRKLIMQEPALVQFMPAPMMAVAVPLSTPDRAFGALTLRWMSSRDLAPHEQRLLRAIADEIAEGLGRLAAEGEPMTAPIMPTFIPPIPQDCAAPDRDGSPERRGAGRPAIGSTTFLYQFQRLATALTSAVSPLDVIGTVLRQVAEPFGGRAVMLCLAEKGRLRTAASAGFTRETRQAVDGLLLTEGAPETDAMMHVQPLLFDSEAALRSAYPDVTRYTDGEATWFLPLIANGRSTGCCVVMGDQRRSLADEELAVVMVMLGQVAQSLQRARFHEFEHNMAQSMQRSLLPGSLPHMEGVLATGRYQPADKDAEVGGDWYDVVKLPDGRVGLLIGDVEGHSLEAAAVMGQLRSGMRAFAGEGHDPAVVLARASTLLSGLDTDLFATCCCVWLDTETGRASIASAGHPPPVLVDADGRATVPPVPVGPPLSVDPNAVYEKFRATLRPGTVLALYTDGLVYTRGAEGTARMLQQLAERHDADLEDLADTIVSGSGAGTAHRADDLALLLVRFEGPGGESRGRVARISIQRDDLQQVRRLRHYLRGSLREWNLDPLIDELELLISEVVTNALIHAGSAVDVRLRRYADRVRVDVRDSDPHPPVVVAVVDDDRPVEGEAESGRGMLIVDAVASAWGSSPSGRGKTTWFELSTVDNAEQVENAENAEQAENELTLQR